MDIRFRRFQHLLAEAKSLPPISVAVVEAAEEQVLEGAKEAADHGLIVPLLIGPEGRIRALAQELGWDLGSAKIVPATGAEETAQIGAQMVADGKAQAIMKGDIHTDVLLHPILSLLRQRHRLSHVFVAELASYHKLLFITDGAINIAPDLRTKAAILQNTVDLLHLLGEGGCPLRHRGGEPGHPVHHRRGLSEQNGGPGPDPRVHCGRPAGV